MRTDLVPMTAAAQDYAQDRTRQRMGGLPRADFMAHLIAIRTQAPQTRPRRRAEPRDAIAAYGGLGQWPTFPGRTLSRSL